MVQVAIIIPFRHRENHLKYWLHYLHPILRRQRIDYGIYIINQVGQARGPERTVVVRCHQNSPAARNTIFIAGSSQDYFEIICHIKKKIEVVVPSDVQR